MAIKTVQKKGGLKTVQNDTEKKTKQTNDVCLKTNDRLFTKTDIVAVLIATIPIILIIGIFWYIVFVVIGTDCLFHGINCQPCSNMTGV